MNIPKVISQMSLGAKIAFCTGADFWQTKQMEQYGIPPMMMADGPHGLRCQAGKADMVGGQQLASRHLLSRRSHGRRNVES